VRSPGSWPVSASESLPDRLTPPASPRTRAIGVFGGTFSPFHNGHLRLALELRERLSLDRVHLIPAGEPPHRAAPGVSAARRLAWVRLACGDAPGLVADDREVRRGGRSYTYDTLAQLRAELPDTPLVLLLGSDAAAQFTSWHRWREIPDLAHLVVVQRPESEGGPASELLRLLHERRTDDPRTLHGPPPGRLMTAALAPLAIYSNRIRGLLAAGRSVRGLVHEAIIDSFTAEDIDFLTHDQNPAHD
jgi:nicotinate-nucleotide adenylyltransferase